MADYVFNTAKGKVCGFFDRVANNDPANSAIVLVLLKQVEIQSVMEDYLNLGTLLAASGNTEADFTNYARKILTDADLSAPTPDNTNNWQTADCPDQVFTSAGGATDNSLVKALFCYDSDTTSGTDSNIIPLTAHDFVVTTTGIDLNVPINSVGVYRAT